MLSFEIPALVRGLRIMTTGVYREQASYIRGGIRNGYNNLL